MTRRNKNTQREHLFGLVIYRHPLAVAATDIINR